MNKRKIVVIDAGYGGKDFGAVYMGRREKDDNLRLALAVGEVLADNGIDVRYTRTEDCTLTPLERIQMANDSEGDFLLSLRRGSTEIPGTSFGVVFLLFANKGVTAEAAKYIQEALEDTGFESFNIEEQPSLVILRRSTIPTLLIEVGFIDNERDNIIFDRDFDRIAQGIAEGILETLQEQERDTEEYYQIQLGAYRVRALAESMAKNLKAQGFPAFIVFEDGLYKVRAGAFGDVDNAVAMEQALKKAGYGTFMVKKPAVY